VHGPVSEQNTSSAQMHERSPKRRKQNEPSPTSLLHVPHWGCCMQTSTHPPSQSFRAFLFLHRSVEADARVLVRAGAAHAAVPTSPMLRSNSRRVTRLGSTVHLRFSMATSRYVPGRQRRNRAGSPKLLRGDSHRVEPIV
jgi:hypothetical protein